MKVFVVITQGQGYNPIYTVEKVFSTEEKAWEFVGTLPWGVWCEVVEKEIDK